jgi:hypothetical protein
MPPINPPTCPPIEMFENVNEKMRLMTMSDIAWPASDPVAWYSMIRSAPRIPKIAPEAPTVIEFGLTTSAPADPASPETK